MEYVDGVCFVLVGVGFGKMWVIINKIVYLIEYCNYLLRNIVVVIFINKVVCEMRECVVYFIGKEKIKGLIIFIFYMLGFEIFKCEYKLFGFKFGMMLFDEYD